MSSVLAREKGDGGGTKPLVYALRNPIDGEQDSLLAKMKACVLLQLAPLPQNNPIRASPAPAPAPALKQPKRLVVKIGVSCRNLTDLGSTCNPVVKVFQRLHGPWQDVDQSEQRVDETSPTFKKVLDVPFERGSMAEIKVAVYTRLGGFAVSDKDMIGYTTLFFRDLLTVSIHGARTCTAVFVLTLLPDSRRLHQKRR
jgi:hypothetical protein